MTAISTAGFSTLMASMPPDQSNQKDASCKRGASLAFIFHRDFLATWAGVADLLKFSFR